MTGFKIDEKMVGKHSFEPAYGDPGWKPMHFNATWGTDDFQRVLANFLINDEIRFDIWGNITMEGLCQNAPIEEGHLFLDYFNKHELCYDFTFNVDGDYYYYTGRKFNIQLYNLLTSHTTCFGTVSDNGGVMVSTSVTYFNLSSIPKFLSTFKFI